MANLNPKKMSFDYNMLDYVLNEKDIKSQDQRIRWYKRVTGKGSSNYKTIQKGMILPSDLVKIANDLKIDIAWLRDFPTKKTLDQIPLTGDYVDAPDGGIIPPFKRKTLANPEYAKAFFQAYNDDFQAFEQWFQKSNWLQFVNTENKNKGLDPITPEEFNDYMQTRMIEMHIVVREYIGSYISDNFPVWKKVREYMNQDPDDPEK